MDDKKAIKVLLGLLDKKVLNKEEKEAINVAIGILGWTSLYQGKLKAMGAARKAKLERDIR